MLSSPLRIISPCTEFDDTKSNSKYHLLLRTRIQLQK